jgi:hypothetical protein
LYTHQILKGFFRQREREKSPGHHLVITGEQESLLCFGAVWSFISQRKIPVSATLQPSATSSALFRAANDLPACAPRRD